MIGACDAVLFERCDGGQRKAGVIATPLSGEQSALVCAAAITSGARFRKAHEWAVRDRDRRAATGEPDVAVDAGAVAERFGLAGKCRAVPATWAAPDPGARVPSPVRGEESHRPRHAGSDGGRPLRWACHCAISEGVSRDVRDSPGADCRCHEAARARVRADGRARA